MARFPSLCLVYERRKRGVPGRPTLTKVRVFLSGENCGRVVDDVPLVVEVNGFEAVGAGLGINDHQIFVHQRWPPAGGSDFGAMLTDENFALQVESENEPALILSGLSLSSS